MQMARVALLVIRAWAEEGSEPPLRIEIRLTADAGREFERDLIFSDPEPVEALVRTWLADVRAGQR
jgi:hypothetical protein